MREWRGKKLPFVAIDSEGISYGEKVKIGNEYAQPQRTVFWMAGRNENYHALDGKPFCDAADILEWLLSLPSIFGRAIFVWFGSSYDATQIFLNLPYEKAWELQHGKPFDKPEQAARMGRYVYFGSYAISYIKQKCLRIRKIVGKKLSQGITIYDVFGFFQTSFLKAVQSIPGSLSKEEIGIIEREKASRSIFSFERINEIKEYTKLELKGLANMMESLRNGLEAMNVKLNRWQGAGSIAAALMKRERTKDHFFDVRTKDLTTAQDWAHRAFFGGRIELLKQGLTKETLYSYDIKSAYPYHNSLLPSMAGGKYIMVENPAREDVECANVLSMFELEFICQLDGETIQLNQIDGFNGPEFYPFPYRDNHGRITFPPHVRGIYMAEEARAAFHWLDTFKWRFTERTLGAGRLRCFYNIKRGLIFRPHPKAENAMGWIRTLFDKRIEIQKQIKETGEYDLTEKVIKLGINSLYGKTAQSVGNQGKAPATANPWYAAAITSGTRAQILRAALGTCEGPESIVAFQTDGIISTKPLGVNEGQRLGEWEFEQIEGRKIFVQPGIYYLPKKPKHRGIKKDLLGTDDFEQWLLDHVVMGWRTGQNVIEYPYRYYVTLGASIASPERFTVAGHWVDSTRLIQLDNLGFKRGVSIFRDELRKRAHKLIDTFPKPAYFHDRKPDDWELPLSEPHRPKWLDDEFAEATELARLNEEIALTEG